MWIGMITRTILFFELMQYGKRVNFLIFSTHITKHNSFIQTWITLTKCATLDKCHYQQMNLNTLRTGLSSMAIVMLMDVFGNLKLDPCFKSHMLFHKQLQIKKVIVGIYAIFHFKSLWCVMKEALLRLMKLIFQMEVSGTIHAMINLKVF